MPKTTTAFRPGEGRYPIDGDECSEGKGFAQFDTRADASYYGNWVNPFTYTIVSYCEGDYTRVQANNREEFIDCLKVMIKWHQDQHTFLGIDPGWKGLDGPIGSAFKELGFGEYLH